MGAGSMFAASRPLGTTLVSHVLGPRVPFYFAGARLVWIIGCAPLADGICFAHGVGSYVTTSCSTSPPVVKCFQTLDSMWTVPGSRRRGFPGRQKPPASPTGGGRPTGGDPQLDTELLATAFSGGTCSGAPSPVGHQGAGCRFQPLSPLRSSTCGRSWQRRGPNQSLPGSRSRDPRPWVNRRPA
jgi:hypothetical protein